MTKKLFSTSLSEIIVGTAMAKTRRTQWSQSTLPQLYHFKTSFDLKTDLKSHVLRLRKDEDTLRSNYGVIRNKYVYIVYFRGFVNCCGIRSRKEAEDAVSHFLTIIEVKEEDLESVSKKIEYKVDNITAAGKLAIDLTLSDISKELPSILSPETGKLSFRPAYFGAIHLQYQNEGEGEDGKEENKDQKGRKGKRRGGGVLTLYHTGSYSIVGVQSEERALLVYETTWNLLNLIHKAHGKILL